MIQRIQTVFLLVVSLCAVVILFTDFATFTADGDPYTFNAFGIERMNKEINFSPILSVPLTAFVFGMLLLPLVAIFQYKKRKNQISLGYVTSGLALGAQLLVVYYVWDIERFIPTEGAIEAAYGIGLIMPAIAIIFNQLAIARIKKDEKLVKSLDRLR